jgi:YfiH family protein
MKAIVTPLLSSVPHVKHGFFTREGGGALSGAYAGLNVSPFTGDVALKVSEARRRVAHYFASPFKDIFTLKQVHGDAIVEVNAEMQPSDIQYREADALWTREKGRVIGVLTADCGPVLMVKRDGCAVAAVHAGWRGAVSEIFEKMIDTLCTQTSCKVEDIVCAVGPCIGPVSFRVGPEVLPAFTAKIDNDSYYTQNEDGSYQIDLAHFIEQRLKQLGVRDIDTVHECTVSNKNRFF